MLATFELEAECTITAASTQEWGFQDYNLHDQLLNDVSEKIDCEISFRKYTWGRSLTMLRSGHIDIMLGVRIKDVDESQFYFIGPHDVKNYVMIISKDEIFTGNANRISNIQRPIGIVSKVYYGASINKYINHPHFSKNIIELPSPKKIPELINRNRISGFIEDRRVVQYWFNKNILNQDNFHAPTPVYNTPVYLAVRKSKISKEKIEKIEIWWSRIENKQLTLSFM